VCALQPRNHAGKPWLFMQVFKLHNHQRRQADLVMGSNTKISAGVTLPAVNKGVERKADYWIRLRFSMAAGK